MWKRSKLQPAGHGMKAKVILWKSCTGILRAEVQSLDRSPLCISLFIKRLLITYTFYKARRVTYPQANMQQWRIQGRGPGGPPPLFFDQNEARRAKKIFWDTALPLSQGLDDRTPPLIWRSGSTTVQWKEKTKEAYFLINNWGHLLTYFRMSF